MHEPKAYFPGGSFIFSLRGISRSVQFWEWQGDIPWPGALVGIPRARRRHLPARSVRHAADAKEHPGFVRIPPREAGMGFRRCCVFLERLGPQRDSIFWSQTVAPAGSRARPVTRAGGTGSVGRHVVRRKAACPRGNPPVRSPCSEVLKKLKHIFFMLWLQTRALPRSRCIHHGGAASQRANLHTRTRPHARTPAQATPR